MKRSQTEIAKYKGEMLEQIMAWKRQEVPRQMQLIPLAQVKALAKTAPPALDFGAALMANPGVALIAEVKRASPSKGLIARDWDPTQIADTYVRSGAAAISCLTDGRYFQGKLEYLTEIKEHMRQFGKAAPVLRKDFVYHEYQVYEARMAGADAILLIVSVLGDNDLVRLLQLAQSLGLQSLVEVHEESEVERALKVGATLIGVNNRNLRTFEVDIETTGRLRTLIPADKVLVGESGIRTTDDVKRMGEMGCNAILVGETFCKLPQSERGAKVKEFVKAGRPEKKAKSDTEVDAL
jgi:indole-3-glycerol phosphate synthase